VSRSTGGGDLLDRPRARHREAYRPSACTGCGVDALSPRGWVARSEALGTVRAMDPLALPFAALLALLALRCHRTPWRTTVRAMAHLPARLRGLGTPPRMVALLAPLARLLDALPLAPEPAAAAAALMLAPLVPLAAAAVGLGLAHRALAHAEGLSRGRGDRCREGVSRGRGDRCREGVYNIRPYRVR